MNRKNNCKERVLFERMKKMFSRSFLYLKKLCTSKSGEYIQLRSDLKQAIGLAFVAILLGILIAYEMGREVIKVVACVAVVLFIIMLLCGVYICLKSIWRHYKAFKEGTLKESEEATVEVPYFVEPRESKKMVYFWDSTALMYHSAALYNSFLMSEFDKKRFGFEPDDMILTSEEEISMFRIMDGVKTSPAYEMYIQYIRNTLGILQQKELADRWLTSSDGWKYNPTTEEELLIARLMDYREIEDVDVTIVTEDKSLIDAAKPNGFAYRWCKK